MDNQKNLFLMFTKTETSVSKYIQKKTNCTFTHSSISLDNSMDRMYSFGRRRPHNFFVAGFIKEDLNNGVYAWNKDAPCRVYRYRVTEKQYDDVIKIIESFIANYKKHKYNMLGLVAIKHNKLLERKYKYACSQFVAHVLLETGIITENQLGRSIWLTSPDNLEQMSRDVANLVYEGTIKDVQSYMKSIKLD